MTTPLEKAHEIMNEKRPTLLKVQEVADELRVSSMTIYRLIQSGELPAIRIGARTFRIERFELEAYLEKNRSE